jgi:hypothetical protein
MGPRLRLGYWADDDFVIISARPVNISKDGLLVIADSPVRSRQLAWIRVDGPSPAESVMATIRGITLLRLGRSALRLALAEDCPPGFREGIAAALANSRPARPLPHYGSTTERVSRTSETSGRAADHGSRLPQRSSLVRQP